MADITARKLIHYSHTANKIFDLMQRVIKSIFKSMVPKRFQEKTSIFYVCQTFCDNARIGWEFLCTF